MALAFGSALSLASLNKVSADSTYTVQSGDTLNKIAKNIAPNDDVATTVNKIADKNNIDNINLIVTGETLDLDLSNTTGTTATTTVAPTTDTTNASTTASQAPTAPVAPAQPNTQQATATPAPSTPTAPATPAPTAPASSSNSDALNNLINKESSGNTGATNGIYYGIGQLSPQARAIYGGNSSDYNDQLNAMKSYIAARYGTAENAWAHSQATGWY